MFLLFVFIILFTGFVSMCDAFTVKFVCRYLVFEILTYFLLTLPLFLVVFYFSSLYNSYLITHFFCLYTSCILCLCALRTAKSNEANRKICNKFHSEPKPAIAMCQKKEQYVSNVPRGLFVIWFLIVWSLLHIWRAHVIYG